MSHEPRICPICKLEIETTHSTQKYHAGRCQRQGYRQGARQREERRRSQNYREPAYRRIQAENRRLAVEWRRRNPALASMMDRERHARGLRPPKWARV